MSSPPKYPALTEEPGRRRLSRNERLRQLLDVAWQLIRTEGTDALTLGRLASDAGITKPVVYDHFGTRNGLLSALYQDFDLRQTAVIDAAIAAAKATLPDKAGAIAGSYIECVWVQGHEIPGVLAALCGSPELAALKRRYHQAFIEKCRKILDPFAGLQGVSPASLWAMLGAAEALAQAAMAGDIDKEQAKDELMAIIQATINRTK